jgi:ATP-dependent helicase/nuclease subunit B
MALRRFTACSTHSLLAEGREFLRAQSSRHPIVVVGATRGAADELVRSACETALLGIHRTTWSQLAASLADEVLALRGQSVCGSLALEVLAQKAIHRCRNQLTYFGPVVPFPGFPRALARTLLDLRLAQVRAAELANLGQTGPDLALLLAAYERELAVNQLADEATRYQVALLAVTQNRQPAGSALLFLDAEVPHATAGKLRESLMLRAPEVLELVRESSTLQKPVTILQAIQQSLFSGEPSEAAEPDGSFAFFSAAGEALEAVEIARRASEAAGRGIPFDQMAILLRSPSRQQPVFQEALRRAGIPAYFSSGVSRPQTAGRAFLAILRWLTSDFAAEHFTEYLSLGQTPSAVGPVSAWEDLIHEARVIDGADRWTGRLNLLEARLMASQRDSALRSLQRLREFVQPLLAQAQSLPLEATWGDWIEALHHLAQATLAEPESVLELLDTLRLLGPVGPVRLGDVISLLEGHLTELRVEPSSQRYGAVFVASAEEARGRSFQVVFVPGLNEGSFPKPALEDPLLLHESRRALRPNLAIEGETEEKDLLRSIVASASQQLIASYSRIDLGGGRKRVLSLYAFELLRAAFGSELAVSQIEEDAFRAVSTRLGWPAPESPEQAIDDAEFDLAMLRPILDDPTTVSVGHMAYLHQAAPELVESLRTRWKRWNHKWYEADGLVGLDVHKQSILEGFRLSERAYSASALQQFAVCPYRFALRSIHGLQPKEEPAPFVTLQPDERGAFFHRAIFLFLSAVKSQGLVLLEEHEGALGSLLDAALEAASVEFEQDLAPTVPSLWQRNVERLRADLRGWLVQRLQREPAWQPLATELAFGREGDSMHDSQSSPEAVRLFGQFLVKGAIDLVEKRPDNKVRVVDFKTGRIPSQKFEAVGHGEQLQPLIYALAASVLLNTPVSLAELHYATLRGNYRKLPVSVNEGTRKTLQKVLAIIDESIFKGFLPPAPRSKNYSEREAPCDTCDFLPVCGPYEPERIARKDPDELTSLRALRNLK